jgi:hypothetical protein
MRKGLLSKKAVAEIAAFILGLVQGTRVNANDSLAFDLISRLQDLNYWLYVLSY